MNPGGGGGFFNQLNPWGTGGGGAPGGHQGGGPGGRGGSDPRPQGPGGGRGGGVSFEEDSADYDFDQLGPLPAADITQTQRDAPAAGDILGPPAIPGGGGGGVNPPPPPPQQAGMGGGQQPTGGDSAYSGIDAVIQKLGGKMYPSSQCS